MTDDMSGADLETHVKEFLQALNVRPEQLIQTHIAQIKKPEPQDVEDFRRYVYELKRVYGQGLEDMYQLITTHGLAICALTDEPEITEPVEKLVDLVAIEADDVPKVLASFDRAATEANLFSVLRLFQAIFDACARGLPIQTQRDELMLDFTSYCLTRFPPTAD